LLALSQVTVVTCSVTFIAINVGTFTVIAFASYKFSICLRSYELQ